MAKLLGAINLERETKCRTAITSVIGSVAFQIVLHCAHTYCILQHRATKLCTQWNMVKTPVCLWQRLFENNVQTEMKRNETWIQLLSLSLCHRVPLLNENSTLLRSMFDRNQNVSCQLSVVKRCFSIVDLIKFCMSPTCACRKFGVKI